MDSESGVETTIYAVTKSKVVKRLKEYPGNLYGKGIAKLILYKIQNQEGKESFVMYTKMSFGLRNKGSPVTHLHIDEIDHETEELKNPNKIKAIILKSRYNSKFI